MRYGQETKNTFPSILTEAYSEPSQTSKMKPIKEVGSIVGVWLDSNSAFYLCGFTLVLCQLTPQESLSD